MSNLNTKLLQGWRGLGNQYNNCSLTRDPQGIDTIQWNKKTNNQGTFLGWRCWRLCSSWIAWIPVATVVVPVSFLIVFICPKNDSMASSIEYIGSKTIPDGNEARRRAK